MKPAPGMLLVAPPMVRDPNFARTVVLLCEHGASGSFGLVLNRPLSVDLSEILEGCEGLVSTGGPVQRDTLHYLHRHGDMLDDAAEVVDGVYWGGDFGAVRIMIETQITSQRSLRFFLGYAGWSAGQLESEIEAGGWFLTRAKPAFVFHPYPKSLWRAVLRHMGGEYALLVNFPDHPRVN